MVVILWVVVMGCQNPDTPAPAGEVSSSQRPAHSTRIVSLAPNTTEILFAIGAGDRVVGVTRYCDFPAEAAQLPKVGGLVDPNAEAIIALKPDLVVGVTSAGDPAIARTLGAAGIAYTFIRMESLDETYTGIRRIGELVGRQTAANALADDLSDRLVEVGKGQSVKPSVLMVFGRKPIVAAGPGTFAHDLLTRAGGRNAISESSQPWPTLDIEQVMKLDPDRILDMSMVEEGTDAFWEDIPGLKANASHNVYRFTDPAMMRPGPRVVDAYQRIAMAIRGKLHTH